MSRPKIRHKGDDTPIPWRPSDYILCVGVGLFTLGTVLAIFAILATSNVPTAHEYVMTRGAGALAFGGSICLKTYLWFMLVGAPIILAGCIARWRENRKTDESEQS